MKCPKCSYISFDYNQICPKCNKDISEERGKLNLPGYKPHPLFLLEALVGARGENQIDLESETFKDTSELEKEITTGMDDTGVMQRDAVFGSGVGDFEMEEALPEEMPAVDLSEIDTTLETEDEEELAVDLEDLAEEPDGVDFTTGTAQEPLGTGTVVLEDLRVPEDDPETDTLGEEISGDDISLDLDAVGDQGLEAAMAFDQDDEEDLSLDLEELGEEAEDLEEIKLEPMSEFEEEVLDLSDIDLEEEKPLEWEADSSHSESEMLTVELEEGKKKEPSDTEELHMEETDEEQDPSGS